VDDLELLRREFGVADGSFLSPAGEAIAQRRPEGGLDQEY
jgi:hypothetical protein